MSQIEASTTRQNVLNTLRTFITSRPGLEYANYGDASAYRSDYRRILRDRDDALTLLRYVEWHSGLTADKIIEAASRAFSGRLSLKQEGEKVQLDYCTGQYYPTEYRAATCAVLAAAIWDYLREDCKPARETDSWGDAIRKSAKRELGARISRRWFH